MINITAVLKEGSVTVSVSDDGRGINAHKALKKAEASGKKTALKVDRMLAGERLY